MEQINYEKLLNISNIYEISLYEFALKKIFDYCLFFNFQKSSDLEINNNDVPHPKNKLAVTFNPERLEFLGDGFLQNVVTELIFEKFPTESHGKLSSLRSRLVRNATLAIIVKKMKIVENIMKVYDTKKEIHEDDRNISLKNAADTFESIIGASFIDRGYESTRSWIRNIYEKYDLINMFLFEDNMLDILQIYTKSSLPKFIYKIEYQNIIISTIFEGKFYSAKNKIKQKAKQELVGKIVKNLIDQNLIPKNILEIRGCKK